MSEYLAGRRQGLESFCHPSSGVSYGARGGAYNGVCHGVNGAEFASAYEASRRLYRLKNNVAAIAADIRKIKYDLTDIDHDIAQTEADLIAPKTPGLRRAQLVIELQNLHEEQRAMEQTMIALKRDHAAARAELDDYEASIAFDGPLPQSAIGAAPARFD